MPRWCACYHTAPAARCKTCPSYHTPKAEKGACGAHAVLNSNDPATRQDVWCPLPYAHNGPHQPKPVGVHTDSERTT